AGGPRGGGARRGGRRPRLGGSGSPSFPPAHPPLPSQPFVVNEMIAMQDAGHSVVILPLYPRGEGTVRHGTFERLRPAAVLPAPLCERRTAGLAWWVGLRHPAASLPRLLGLR